MKSPRLGDDAAILSPRALPAGIRPAGERIDTRPGLEKCCAALGRQGWIGQVLDTRSAAPAATSLPSAPAPGVLPSIIRAHWRMLLIVLPLATDRKSTRLNSSHVAISYAVFCLKKK